MRLKLLGFAVFMLAFATAYQCVNVWCFGPLDDAEAAPGVTPSSDGIDSSISSWRIGCDPGQSAISIFQDGLDILPIGGGGILQKSIEELRRDPRLVEVLRKDLDAVNAHGSISKGLQTIEFSSTNSLKESLVRHGEASLIDDLAFVPVLMMSVLGSRFELIGADTHGKLIGGRGWGGYVQSLADGHSGIQIELIELQIESALGDTVEVVTEFLNDKVGGVRAFVQKVKDGVGADVYSIQWSDGERSFTLNTKSLARSESLAMASVILERYRGMPHQGWKSPYVLDSENPLHRLAIQRNQRSAVGVECAKQENVQSNHPIDQ